MLSAKSSGYGSLTGGQHKVVITEEKRLKLITLAHDELGHKGIFTANSNSNRWQRVLKRWYQDLKALSAKLYARENPGKYTLSQLSTLALKQPCLRVT